MAIEPVKKISIISPVASGQRLMKALNRLGAIDITDAGENIGPEKGHLTYQPVSTEESDEILHKIDFILNLINTHAPEEENFFKSLAPVPHVVEQHEVVEVLNTYDLEGRYRLAHELDETYRRAERARGELLNKCKELESLSDLPYDMGHFKGLKRTCLFIGSLPKKNLTRLETVREQLQTFVWEEIIPLSLPDEFSADSILKQEEGKKQSEYTRILCACLIEDYERVIKALSEIEFKLIELPHIPGRVYDHILELNGDVAELDARMEETARKIHALASERRSLVILKAFWLANKNQQIAEGKAIQGKWLRLISGYILAKDIERFEITMNKEFPECSYFIEEPSPDEDVPVHLTLPRTFRPLSLLIAMFGLPHYRAFDPTPFINLNFYVFFGICFSDVGYGVMLVILASYLSSKTRAYEGVNNFARILLYSGVSTIIFGALLGSWFGDLYQPKYLGENNLLLWLQSKFVVLDPMNKTIVALLLALFIGVLNQFYGISLKMYGSIKNKDWKTAIFDGLFWLILLPGLLIMVSRLFVDTPPMVFNIGLSLFGAGALGLILTQGRSLKNPFAKILGGLVSLYGIMGSYGITAFIGDILSYCRLLALGLTTSIVGMTFNMIGGIVRDIPFIGSVLFIVVIVGGHIFNFAISLLGAFVHSMRLVFVEFFGRFYEGGARPFKPLGFDSPLCILKKTHEGR